MVVKGRCVGKVLGTEKSFGAIVVNGVGEVSEHRPDVRRVERDVLRGGHGWRRVHHLGERARWGWSQCFIDCTSSIMMVLWFR